MICSDASAPSSFWRIERFDEVESTNDLALERARAGEPEGLVISTSCQQKGRGRGGRSWYSPPGTGIYFSALLRPDLPAGRVTCLPIVAGVALAEGLSGLGGRPVGLKWPNDLRVGGKKLGGILCEYESKGGSPPAVIVGVGVNLKAPSGDFPPDFQGRATSLAAAGAALPPADAVLKTLLNRLESWYTNLLFKGFSAAKDRWTEMCDNFGDEVSLQGVRSLVRGRVRGIDESGGLLLTRTDGKTIRIEAGEVMEG